MFRIFRGGAKGMVTPESRKTATVHTFGAARNIFAALAEDRATSAADAQVHDDRGASELPRIFGYEIHARIGRGASGDVFAAVRAGMNRRLAVKFLHQRLGDRASTNRAWRELQVLSQLHLPCLPRLLDYGEADGRLFLVTEYISGSTLLQHCHDRSLNTRQRVELLVEVADAVHCLHEHGVIHRDIKPTNILIDPNGRPLIVDLGIATLLSDNVMETLTVEGAPIGSPAFMAPEQARGDRQQISTRSDVYGLGATAYVVLTGQPPFDPDATLHEMLHRITHDEPRDPRAINASVPGPLADVLLKAVAPKPGDRYASAAEFAADLRRWLAGDAVEAGTLGLLQRMCRAVSRHPVYATALLCVLLASVFVSAAVLTTWRMTFQPSVVVTDRNGIARLLSTSGRVLHTWRATTADNLYGGWLMDADETGLDDDIVILGFKVAHTPEYDNQLLAFRADNPEEILWSSGTSGPDFDPPPPISRWEGDTYRLSRLIRADVFDDPPGDELIAVHQNVTYSPTCIRVYDLRGNVLFEVWHDGGVHGLAWLEDAHRLVCAAVNSECNLNERGEGRIYRSVRTQSHPFVVFAIDIEAKVRHDKWISPRKLPQTMDAAWYKCLLPIEEYDRACKGARMEQSLRPAINPESRGLVRLEIGSTGDDANIGFVMLLNRDGEVVRYRNTSEFEHWNPDYDITRLYLGELPKYNRQPPIPVPEEDAPPDS